MSKLVVEGGRKLEGTMRIHGAKNAILPILAATLLNSGKNVINECPRLKDVYASLEILKHLGCDAHWDEDTVVVDSAHMEQHHIPDHLMREMRSSVIFLGAILARRGKALISYPGGCELGPRPIDLHIKAFKKLGISIEESHGQIYCKANNLKGTDIALDFPSVGATENIMLVAAMAHGKTTISNAAKEPEIVDLQNYLNAMGADISGAGTPVITIHGVESLHEVEYKVIPDRIEAITYLAAAAITGGSIRLTNVIPEHIQAVTSVLQEAGCSIKCNADSLEMTTPKRLKNVEYIRTMPYPGFPTDAQAIIMAMLTVADGVSVISENMFDSRYKHIVGLNQMGANVLIDGRLAVIRGVNRLSGTQVNATDLRGAAGLVVAALNADGITEIHGLDHLDRGYVSFEKGLIQIGANVKRIL